MDRAGIDALNGGETPPGDGTEERDNGVRVDTSFRTHLGFLYDEETVLPPDHRREGQVRRGHGGVGRRPHRWSLRGMLNGSDSMGSRGGGRVGGEVELKMGQMPYPIMLYR